MKGSLIFVAVTGAPIVAGHDNGNVDSPIATISGRHVSARSAAFTLAHPASQIGSPPPAPPPPPSVPAPARADRLAAAGARLAAFVQRRRANDCANPRRALVVRLASLSPCRSLSA